MYETPSFSKWKPHFHCFFAALFAEIGFPDVRKQAIMAALVSEILPNNSSSPCFAGWPGKQLTFAPARPRRPLRQSVLRRCAHKFAPGSRALGYI